MPSYAATARLGPGLNGLLHFLLLLAMWCVTAVRADNATPSVVVPAQGQYKYMGCYNETSGLSGTSGARTLDGGINEVLPGTMTIETCLSFCGGAQSPYKYAGLEFARECWCARLLNSNADKFQDSSCDLGCDGNSTQACGGSLKLTIYQLSAAPSLRATYGVALLATAAVLITHLL